jgi:3-phenylpropionate/trans-cinnamate dioxygenase ferredoxin reductase subunit
MNTKPNFIIVGGGMAGAIAAQTLREEGFDGKITLVGQEQHAPYERPPLSKDYLQGKADRDSIFVHPEPWYAERAVDLSLGTAVTSLDPASRTVTTSTGAQLGYDKLLLATGSKPRRLGVPGADLDGVYYLRNVEDSERLKIEFAQAKRVVIIGAGWIAELHRSHSVDLRYRTTAVELTGRHGEATGVMLSDGTRIDADMIIVGIGAAPRTELAAESGLKIDNGIVVDEHLRSSDPDIFAAGDIAHAYNPRLGRHIRVEHWANARRQGVIAAKAMLGQDVVDVRPSYFFTDQYDLGMEYIGDIGPAGYDRVIFRRYADSRQVIVFWLREQRIQAGMNINIWDVAEDIERLIESPRPINADELADPAIPLTSLL